jgi:hypothetical protein
MRPALIAACCAFLLLVWPVHGQSMPASSSARVVFDATVMVVPPSGEAPCVRLEAGQLTVRVRNTGTSPWGGPTPELHPTGFRFFGYRGGDPRGRVDLPVTSDESSAAATLAGGVYCWVLDVDAPVSTSTNLAIRTNYTQFIALRITLTPQ